MMKVMGAPDLQTGWSTATLTIRYLRPYTDPTSENAAAGTYYGNWNGTAMQARGGGDFVIPGPGAVGDPQPLLEVTSTVIYPGLGPVQSRREGLGHPNTPTAGEFNWGILGLDNPPWNGIGGSSSVGGGTPGATGPAGPQGDKGDKGDTGNTGATGANGADANLPPLPSPLSTPRVLTASPNGTNNTALSWEEKGSGSSLTVREVDGSPSAVVAILEFPNGSVTMSGTGANAKASIAVGADPTLSARVAALEQQILSLDTVPPAVGLASSSSNVTSAGNITLTAAPTDNIAVSEVVFYRGIDPLGTRLTPPWTWPVALTSSDNGTLSFTATAFDSAIPTPNETVSNQVNVTVAIPGHTLNLTASSLNVTASGPFTLTATPNDLTNVGQVRFYRNGNLLGNDTTSPFQNVLNLISSDNGTINFLARLYDVSDALLAESAMVSVSVNIAGAIVRPSYIPSDAYWLRADNLSGSENQNIRNWPADVGPTATSASAKRLRLNYVNGKKALEFPRNDDPGFTVPASVGIFGQTIYLAAVAKTDDPATGGFAPLFRQVSQYLFIVRPDGFPQMSQESTDAIGTVSTVSAWHLFEATVTAGDINVYVDGVLVASAHNPGGGPAGSAENWLIGGYSNFVDWLGWMAEAIIMPRVPSGAELSDLRSNLLAFYGLPITEGFEDTTYPDFALLNPGLYDNPTPWAQDPGSHTDTLGETRTGLLVSTPLDATHPQSGVTLRLTQTNSGRWFIRYRADLRGATLRFRRSNAASWTWSGAGLDPFNASGNYDQTTDSNWTLLEIGRVSAGTRNIVVGVFYDPAALPADPGLARVYIDEVFVVLDT